MARLPNGSGIAFRIRIKDNTQVPAATGQSVPVKASSRGLHARECLVFGQARPIWGIALYLSGTLLLGGDYLIVVAPSYSTDALPAYGQRWGIGTLSGCLKSRGFCLEKTHVTDPERLWKLVALLALAFCWAHAVGEWLAQRRPLKLKKHARLAKSVFRSGVDHPRRILCNLGDKKQASAFTQVIAFLSCT